MINKVVLMHLEWQQNGIDFEHAISIRDRLWDQSPFSSIGAMNIDSEIKKTIKSYQLVSAGDVSKLSYFILNDKFFDGDLSFLEECVNLEYLQISGICSEKITSLESLRKLTKLRSIDLEHHSFISLEPLNQLQNLEELLIFNNPVKSIAPIIELRKLKKVKVPFYNEVDFFTVLQNSKKCTIECTDEERSQMCKIYWFNEWAFRHEHFFPSEEPTKFIYALVPLMQDDFIQKEVEVANFFEKFKDIATPEICRLANEYLENTYQCKYSRSLFSQSYFPYCEFNVIKKPPVFKEFNFI